MKEQKYNWSYLLAVTLVSAMGGLLFGYDWVVIGGAKPFYEPFFGITGNPALQGWVMSCAIIGCLGGAVLSGWLSDKFGRKRLLILSAMLFIIASLGTGSAGSLVIFIIFRMLGGIGIGLASNLSPMYIAEITPASVRGRFVSLNQLTIVIGILAAQLINWRIARPVPPEATVAEIVASWNGQMGWRWMFYVCAIPAALFFILMWFVPESPRWLAKKARNHRKVHEILEKIGGYEYADAELSSIKSSIGSVRTRINLRILKEPGITRLLIIGIVIAVFQQWCGINVIFNYAQEIFATAGYGVSDIMFNIVITGSVNLIFTFAGMALIDKLGRKALMLIGAGGLAAIYAVIGSMYFSGMTGIPLLIMVVTAIACYAMTLAPVTWVLLSEIFPNRIRGFAMSVATFALWTGCFTLTYTFPILNQLFEASGTFLLYGFICILGFGFIMNYLPETKGKSLEEIEKELTKKINMGQRHWGTEAQRFIYFLIIILSVISGCRMNKQEVRKTISLTGEWGFKIDSLDQGIEKEWYNTLASESVRLPGSMAENGKGNEVTINTPWTGDIIDRSYFTDKKYEKYRQPGNIKIPFWLKPVKYYKGVAWYQKEVDIPEDWNGKRIVLHLERCHWESTLFVNGKKAGTQNSLSTPHEYDITDLLVRGKNLLSIRMDNRIKIPIGVNSHSISDHTQSNWNGITGNISLYTTSPVYIDAIKVFPDIENSMAKVIVSIKNPGNSEFEGKLSFRATDINGNVENNQLRKTVRVETRSDEQQIILTYKMRNPWLWSEFKPIYYRMTVSLTDNKKEISDQQSVDFGMREFKTNGTHFEVNGIPAFLRGTTECCIFPLTGYPPADVESWEKILKTCKDYGLNHIRFHSFCPPEAAFIAADELGIYFHIECSSWANQGSSIGNGGPVDQFIYDESNRIIKEYGNHPSFCMLAYGNEPAGKNQGKYLGELINYWKSIDNRRVYTSAGGWPIIPENDYNVHSEPRIQHWGEGLKSKINAEPPQTMFDFRDFVSKYKVPTVSHEIGQWCVYPDFKEIEKYKGPLKPSNFEIFRETLEEHGMGDQAEDFLMASGKLQVLCYKADIEAALRTPGFGGFELLQLHDFPGQGTALVGILNPFFESKGYVTPEEFRMFCNETVPLARMKKMIWHGGETFDAMIEITHFGPAAIHDVRILCQIKNNTGKILQEETMTMDEIKIGHNIVGVFARDLNKVDHAEKLKLGISISGTSFRNEWDIWVFPEKIETDPGKVVVTGDPLTAERSLRDGKPVLLLTYGKVSDEGGAKVAIGFSSIFWNTAWTGNQPPHTLGILCDPEHPLFNDFPTEFHSNWQWWDPVTHSQAMIMDGFPSELKPLVQPIDTWFENRKLALAFEAKCNNGKLMVCSINMTDSLDQRPVTKQLLSSMLKYMNSESFDPQIMVNLKMIKGTIF